MKSILITIAFFAICSLAKAQTLDVTKKQRSDTLIFTAVEKMPEFPNGGIAGFFKYLKDSLRYPDAAKAHDTQGRVMVTFVIEKDGSASNVRVLKSLSKVTDAEAIRLIKECPKWIPGYQNGKPARVMCPISVPIIFRLSDE
jgi:protein TonB